MKNCFHVSTVLCPTRGTTVVVQSYHPCGVSVEKLNFRGLNPSSLPSGRALSPSSLLANLSRRSRTHKPLTVCKAAVDEVLAVTDASWEKLVVGNETPVLVEFWAPWCGPCRMIAPIIKELAKEYAGKVACYTVNTDDCPNIATKYGIRSIPTVLFFKKGEKKESVIGAVPKGTLSSAIQKYIDA